MDEKKKNRLIILIFSLIAILVPTITGLILSIVLRRTVFLEAFYIIFGVITLLFALFRSRYRDNKNYRSTQKVKEDKEEQSYKEFRNAQIILYSIGLFLLLCSVIAFLIGNYVLGY